MLTLYRMLRGTAQQAIPKQLHFIWVGTRVMPDANLTNVIAWLQNNKDCTVNLWVDHPVYSRAQLIEKYIEAIRRVCTQSQLSSQEIDSIIKKITFQNPNDLLNKPEYANAKKYFTHEQEKIRPNYGSASDILRYILLYEHGGLYFDSDTKPDKIGFSDIGLFNPQSRHRLLINTHAYGGNHEFANDIIFSTPKNPLLQSVIDGLMRTYTSQEARIDVERVKSLLKTLPRNEATDTLEYQTESDLFNRNRFLNTPMRMAYSTHAIQDLLASTIMRTGPGLLRTGMCEYLSSRNQQMIESNIEEIASGVSQITPELSNAWIKKNPRTDIATYENALDLIIKMAKFEVENYHVLRLDDFINDIHLLFNEVERDHIAADLMSHVLNEQLHRHPNLKVIQASSPKTLAFIKKLHLEEKTFMFPRLRTIFDNKENYNVYMQEIIPNLTQGVKQNQQELVDMKADDPIRFHEEMIFILKQLQLVFKPVDHLFEKCQLMLTTEQDLTQLTDDQKLFLSDYLSSFNDYGEIVQEVLYAINELMAEPITGISAEKTGELTTLVESVKQEGHALQEKTQQNNLAQQFEHLAGVKKAIGPRVF